MRWICVSIWDIPVLSTTLSVQKTNKKKKQTHKHEVLYKNETECSRIRFLFWYWYHGNTACVNKNSTIKWKILEILAHSFKHGNIYFDNYIEYSTPRFLSHLIWVLQSRDRVSRRKSTKYNWFVRFTPMWTVWIFKKWDIALQRW